MFCCNEDLCIMCRWRTDDLLIVEDSEYDRTCLIGYPPCLPMLYERVHASCMPLHLGLSVQEAHALQLHLSALGHQKEGRYHEAQAAFEELLQADFIHTASPVSPTPWPIT